MVRSDCELGAIKLGEKVLVASMQAWTLMSALAMEAFAPALLVVTFPTAIVFGWNPGATLVMSTSTVQLPCGGMTPPLSDSEVPLAGGPSLPPPPQAPYGEGGVVVRAASGIARGAPRIWSPHRQLA